MLESKKYRFLGEAPKNITGEELLNYFLYTFEFTWNAKAFEEIKHDIKNYFNQELKDLRGKLAQSLSLGQEWWALVFIALKRLATYEEYDYPISTLNFILNKIDTISVEELEEYGNTLNDVFLEQFSDSLTIRPLELKKLNSDAYRYDKVLDYFLTNKDNFLKIFQSLLDKSDIDMMYINELTLDSFDFEKEYGDIWHTYYEIFIGFSESMYHVIQQSPKNSEDEYVNLLEEILMVFAIGSIKNNNKIDNLVQSLLQIIKPFYIDNFKTH